MRTSCAAPCPATNAPGSRSACCTAARTPSSPSIAGNLCLDNDRFLAVGLEISANHLRPVTRGAVIGTARAIHVGRNTQVWDIRIEDEEGRMTCISRLTLAVIPKQ